MPPSGRCGSAGRERGWSQLAPSPSWPRQPYGVGAALSLGPHRPFREPAQSGGASFPCAEAVPRGGAGVGAGAEREAEGSPRQPLRCGGARHCRGPAAPVTLRNDLPCPARLGAPPRAAAAAPQEESGPGRLRVPPRSPAVGARRVPGRAGGRARL